MIDRFEVSYVTTLPKIANAPRVSIYGQSNKLYKIKCYETIANYSYLIFEGYCRTNETLEVSIRQYYTNWLITIYDEENGSQVFSESFDLENKNVFIKMDSYALGDTIAWIPYVREFKNKHNCNIICSTFHNYLFSYSYPDIMFVKPNTQIENIYAQYYIGASYDNNPKYCRLNASECELQRIASDTLGLEYHELRPELIFPFGFPTSRFTFNYVTLSEFGSAENKHWKKEGGWQSVVDYIKSKGYEVVVISKEKTNLKGVIDMSGDFPLTERMCDIKNAKFHLGVSSGLSWLAWALGTHVVMISDVTPNWHEFNTDITRLNANNLDSVNYLAEGQTTIDEVVKKLGELIVSRYL